MPTMFNNLVRMIALPVWHWVCFLAWLPWFVVSMPWQLQRAYGRVMRAFDLKDNGTDELLPLERLVARRSARRRTPYRHPPGQITE
jgi:hypothetical protein